MHRVRAAVVVLSLVPLCACSTTTEELHADPGEQGTFRVALPFRTVYSNFGKRAEGCFHGGTPAAHFYVAADESKPRQFGTFDVVEEGVVPSLRRVIISADITATPDGTDVSYFANKHVTFMLTYRATMVEWANGTGEKCGDF